MNRARGFSSLSEWQTEIPRGDADVLSAKIVKMRIFGDENEKMNRSVTDIGGDIAVVPNFTLLASCRRGNLPRFYGERASRTSRAAV